jgi:hypothetical protein
MNYRNSQSERDQEYEKRGVIGQFLMDAGTQNGEVIGEYPETVAIKQRKQILGEEDTGGRSYKFEKDSGEISYSFTDAFGKFEYALKVESNNAIKPLSNFNYRTTLREITNNESVVEMRFTTPVSTNQEEIDYLASNGFQTRANKEKDIRKAAFGAILQNKLPLERDWGDLYEATLKSFNKNLTTSLMSDYSKPNNIPVGYMFGYVSDDLTADSFEYTPSPNEGELGTFASSRIVPLDPSIYGGSYNNPPYYVEPRQFTGWIEVATRAFSSPEGCDPKNPPLFYMGDIEDRVKKLNTSLRTDPRLSQPSECVSVKPFHLLLENKNKSNLDGVVRTTLRTYLGEYFIKGYGLFSNLQVRAENYDQSMMLYIVNKMKKEMRQLGISINNKKVRIVRDKYWLSFLEQCVETYQRMVEVDGIEPPEEVSDALNKIQMGLDRYRVIGKKIKKAMRKSDLVPSIGKSSIRKPSLGYDPLEVVSSGMVTFGLQALAYRLTPEDEKDTFFDGGVFENLQKVDIRYASLKKIQFFQKIYFIKLFEEESILIMSELIKDEMNRMAKIFVDGISDKPNYYDLSRSIFGMTDIFPSSTSRIGLNDFYVDKQRGVINTGMVPSVQSNNTKSPIAPSDDVQFLVESYVRLEDRVGAEPPLTIKNRQTKHLGAISLSDMSEFVSTNLPLVEDNYLSDFFGDLTFIYEGSLKSLFDKGFTTSEHISRLIDLNKSKGAATTSLIRAAHSSYLMGRSFADMKLVYDKMFLLEGEDPEPVSTMGTTGVKYGLRLSIVLPSSISEEVRLDLLSDAKFIGDSKKEKSYMFDDGGFVLPLVSSEINVRDSKFIDFDPFSGVEPYDLECLINKMVSTTEFQVLVEKILCMKQASSMLAIYCMETLPAAIGRDETERDNIDGDPDVDDWDRIVNKFGKNFLRREFKSIYLSRHEDGQSPDDDDDSERMNLLKMGNPFDFFSLPSVKLPWWLKRRAKTKIYDANGQECADPKKDLQ